MWGGSFLMYSQGRNFLSCFTGSLWTGLEVSKCLSANWSNKIAPQHILDIGPSWKPKHVRDASFWCTFNDWTSHNVYWQVLGSYSEFYEHYFAIRRKNDPKTHIGLYWSILTWTILRDWSLTWNYMTWNTITNTDKYITSLGEWCS